MPKPVDVMQTMPLNSIAPLQAGAEDVTFLSASSSSYAQLAIGIDQKPFDDKQNSRQALA